MAHQTCKNICSYNPTIFAQSYSFSTYIFPLFLALDIQTSRLQAFYLLCISSNFLGSDSFNAIITIILKMYMVCETGMPVQPSGRVRKCPQH